MAAITKYHNYIPPILRFHDDSLCNNLIGRIQVFPLDVIHQPAEPSDTDARKDGKAEAAHTFGSGTTYFEVSSQPLTFAEVIERSMSWSGNRGGLSIFQSLQSWILGEL